jgi:ketosteroid isomerase-like protein
VTAEDTRELVLRYWLSWQEGDWEAFRSCLADEIFFDGVYARLHDPDRLVEFRRQADPLRGVTMLESFFGSGEAALLYTGTSTETGAQLRVAELIETRRGRIARIRSVTGVRQSASDVE